MSSMQSRQIFPPEENYQDRFQKIITSGFAKYDLTLDQETRAKFSELAKRGAASLTQRISREMPNSPKREMYVEKAEKKLDQIVQRMVKQTKDDGDSKVNIKTYEAVMRGICPLWPFC
jgi:Zn-dependent oligopeptidase